MLERGMVLIRNRRVGVCGSDLHYFQHGYCAGFVPDRPFVLGHELAAEVVAVGDGVDTVQVGQKVTVNPARSCGLCTFCKAGRPNLCERIIMLGSASTKPPTDGALAEFTLVRADQCFVLPVGFDDGLAALMEPLAVSLHAAKRAGVISGKRVLVLGGGTIGLLTAVVVRAFGATLVAVSDIVPERRAKALELVADEALDPTMSTTTKRPGKCRAAASTLYSRRPVRRWPFATDFRSSAQVERSFRLERLGAKMFLFLQTYL